MVDGVKTVDIERYMQSLTLKLTNLKKPLKPGVGVRVACETRGKISAYEDVLGHLTKLTTPPVETKMVAEKR